jgi:hypothetical protein
MFEGSNASSEKDKIAKNVGTFEQNNFESNVITGIQGCPQFKMK